MSPDRVKVIATNRKARHDYIIEDTLEAGMVLTGSEIKSIRTGQVNLRDGYAAIRAGEVWLLNVHITPYKQASYQNHEPRRERKLLLHRREINRLTGKLQEKGLTLVPLRIYLKTAGPKWNWVWHAAKNLTTNDRPCVRNLTGGRWNGPWAAAKKEWDEQRKIFPV